MVYEMILWCLGDCISLVASNFHQGPHQKDLFLCPLSDLDIHISATAGIQGPKCLKLPGDLELDKNW